MIPNIGSLAGLLARAPRGARAGLDSTVVVAGSLCLVGEVRSMLLGHHDESHAHVGL